MISCYLLHHHIKFVLVLHGSKLRLLDFLGVNVLQTGLMMTRLLIVEVAIIWGLVAHFIVKVAKDRVVVPGLVRCIIIVILITFLRMCLKEHPVCNFGPKSRSRSFNAQHASVALWKVKLLQVFVTSLLLTLRTVVLYSIYVVSQCISISISISKELVELSGLLLLLIRGLRVNCVCPAAQHASLIQPTFLLDSASWDTRRKSVSYSSTTLTRTVILLPILLKNFVCSGVHLRVVIPKIIFNLYQTRLGMILQLKRGRCLPLCLNRLISDTPLPLCVLATPTSTRLPTQLFELAIPRKLTPQFVHLETCLVTVAVSHTHTQTPRILAHIILIVSVGRATSARKTTPPSIFGIGRTSASSFLLARLISFRLQIDNSTYFAIFFERFCWSKTGSLRMVLLRIFALVKALFLAD